MPFCLKKIPHKRTGNLTPQNSNLELIIHIMEIKFVEDKSNDF